MKRHSSFCAVLAALLALPATTGCVQSTAEAKVKPFDSADVDACLTIVIDMSSSFADSWEDRAYDLFLQLMDRFFIEGAGANAKVIIGQLSGDREVVMFEGAPGELLSRYRSPEELNAALAEHSHPGGSAVFHATKTAIDHVRNASGVTPDTRLLTVVLSDLIDSEQDEAVREEEGEAMLASLKAYQQIGGALALYYVSPSEIEGWRAVLKEAGFEPGMYLVETTCNASPTLPRFE